jgi:hypothetical protein
MRADELAYAFNTGTERRYWRATVAGTRVNPEVNFTSRASMVTVTYRVASDDFTVAFSKSAVAFGDFMASAYRSLSQVLGSLKAAGLPFFDPMDEGVLRVEYNHKSKAVTAHMARQGDEWADAEPVPFKVPVRENVEIFENTLDGEKYAL